MAYNMAMLIQTNLLRSQPPDLEYSWLWNLRVIDPVGKSREVTTRLVEHQRTTLSSATVFHFCGYRNYCCNESQWCSNQMTIFPLKSIGFRFSSYYYHRDLDWNWAATSIQNQSGLELKWECWNRSQLLVGPTKWEIEKVITIRPIRVLIHNCHSKGMPIREDDGNVQASVNRRSI